MTYRKHTNTGMFLSASYFTANAVSKYGTFIVLAFLFCGCATNQPKDETNLTVSTQAEVNEDILNIDEQSIFNEATQSLARRDFKRAEELYLSLKDVKPSYIPLWANLAMLYFQGENYEKALTMGKIAIDKGAKSAQLENLLGLICIELNEYQNAELHYKNAIDLNNSYALAHYNLALLYDIYYQDLSKSIKHYKRYLELTNFEDKFTTDWLEQLELSLGNG